MVKLSLCMITENEEKFLEKLAKIYHDLGDEEMARLAFSRAAELYPQYNGLIKK